jgi:beta-lactamase regulating signal transducer with metallopeptidase domain
VNLTFLFDRIAGVSIQTAILVVIIFLLTRALTLSSRVRAGLWTLVFAHALVGMFFAVPVSLPLSREPAPLTVQMVSREKKVVGPAMVQKGSQVPVDPKAVAVAVWGLGVAALLFTQLRRELFARRRLADSVPVEGAIAALAQGVAAEMDIRLLHVRLSASLASPCVSGLLRPTIYLPFSLAHADEDQLRAVLVHELAHVRHGDLPASILAAFTRCLFFFHPMTWVAHREWAIHREAACDAEVLRRSGIGLAAYCDLLIQFAQGRPLLSATIQAATRGFSHLHRRICEMKNTQPKKRGAAPVATIAALVVSALAAVPVTLTARNAMTHHRPEHASGQLHSITEGLDGPTLTVDPNDSVRVQTLPDVDEKDPLLKTEVNLSLTGATFDSAIKALASSAKVKIDHPPVKMDPISMELTANLRETLDAMAQLGNMSWERTGDRSFRMVPSSLPEGFHQKKPSNREVFKADPQTVPSNLIVTPDLVPMLPAGAVVSPDMIGEKSIVDVSKVPLGAMPASPANRKAKESKGKPSDPISPAGAVSAVNLMTSQDNSSIPKGVIIIVSEAVLEVSEGLLPSAIEFPQTPGVYDMDVVKDASAPHGLRFTFNKSDIQILGEGDSRFIQNLDLVED